MQTRQAVIDALNHVEHKTVPYHMDFTQQALDNLIAYTGDPRNREKTGLRPALYSVLGLAYRIAGPTGLFPGRVRCGMEPHWCG